MVQGGDMPLEMRSHGIELAPVTSSAALYRRSADSWYDHKSNTIWIGTSIAADLRNSVQLHEMSHFLVHVSTPYGWLLEECARAERHSVMSYCLDHYNRSPNNPIFVPLYDVARLVEQRCPQLEHLLDLCDKYVKPWSHVMFLQNVLEGEGFSEVASATHNTAGRSLDIVEEYLANLSDSFHPLRFSPKAFPLPNIPATPDATFPGEPEIRLGAKHIFEGIATQLESSSLLVQDLQKGTRLPYWALWLLTVMRMGKDRVRSPEEYERLRNTFFALCDLALFVPAGNLYGQLRTEEITWYDIHPAFRFITALNQATKLEWIDNLEKDMLPYQEWVSELVHWPAPIQFLKLGSALKGDNPSLRRHAEACRIRLENPSAFLELGQHLQQGYRPTDDSSSPAWKFFIDYLPMLYTPKTGQLFVRNYSFTATEPLNLVLPWFLSQFSYYVTEEGVVRYEDLLPNEVRYETVWSNVKSREDFVALLQKGIPLFSPDRFAPLKVGLAQDD